MAGLTRGIRRVSEGLNIIAGVGLVGMTVLTCADVVLRLFRHPILGTYEIVGFMGALVAGFAMAYTTIERGHVAVEVLIMLLPRPLQTGVYLITHLLGSGLFALLSWESWRYGNDLKAAGEVSLTLEWPFWPVLYGLAFAALLVAVILLVDFWLVLIGRERAWYLWKKN